MADPVVVEATDNLSVLKALFSRYGLTELAGAVAKYQTDAKFKNAQNKIDEFAVLEDLRQQPAYKTRFAAKLARDAEIARASSAGEYTLMQPISEGEQIALEQEYSKVARKSGLPVGFYDNPTDFSSLIANDVSVDEYTSRVNMAQQAALTADVNLRNQLQQQFGVAEGELTAFFLDPNRAREVTARNTNDVVRKFNQAALQAAGVSGGVAAKVAEQSVPVEVNASYVSALAKDMMGLTQETVGGEQAAVTEQQLTNVLVAKAQGNEGVPDYQAEAAVQRGVEVRKAKYASGGQIAATAQGVIGLTSAQS